MPTFESFDHVPISPEPSAIKVGDILALTYYVKVDKVKKAGSDYEFHVTDIYDKSGMSIKGGTLISRNSTADQYHREVKISRSAILEIMKSATNGIMTVCFIKDDGSERMARVRYLRPEDNFGRSYAYDFDKLDKDGKPSMIQIDHRSINWMVYEGVKYISNKQSKPSDK